MKFVTLIKTLFFILLIDDCLACVSDNQHELLVVNGNLIYKAGNEVKQLTKLGQDSEACLSSDKKMVVFIRTYQNQYLEGIRGQALKQEIWLINISGEHSKLLVESTPNDEPKYNLTSFHNLQFDGDSKKVFFQTEAWAVSSAIHSTDIKSNKTDFITDGNSLNIIKNGKFKNYLITEKHKYYPEGGSYDSFWLVSPSGEEVHNLGSSLVGIDKYLDNLDGIKLENKNTLNKTHINEAVTEKKPVIQKPEKLSYGTKKNSTAILKNPTIEGVNQIKLVPLAGVYMVPIILNDVLKINVILDSGAADVSIAPDVVSTLIKTGTVEKSDGISGLTYQVADGTTAQRLRFKLKSLQIGNKIFNDVICSIAPNAQSPMLLGQSLLERLGRYSIDYKNGVMQFE